jgi:hypothetical protein
MQNSLIAMELLRIGLGSTALALTFIIDKLVRKSLILVKAQVGTASYYELESCAANVAVPAGARG